jgi:hypothetical protein
LSWGTAKETMKDIPAKFRDAFKAQLPAILYKVLTFFVCLYLLTFFFFSALQRCWR